MKHTIQIEAPKTSIKGTVKLNGSKSISNRVLVIDALAHNTFNIENLSDAQDTVSLKHALDHPSFFIDAGAGGTTYRFLTAYLSTLEGEHILTGSDRMKERPIHVLVDALRLLGANIEYLEKEGFPPLKISGKLTRGGKVTVPGDVSSQFLTALLLIAPELEGGLELSWTGTLVSKPYILMTLNLMEHFGVKWELAEQSITVEAGHYVAKDFYVEGDWSAASYFYSIAALSQDAEIDLVGLEEQSVQGDAVIEFMMSDFGINSDYTARDKTLHIRKADQSLPEAFTYDFLECPDLAQTLVSALAGLKISGSFSGLKTLKIKETDRVEALRLELLKFGAVFREEGDDEWTLDCTAERQPEHRPIIETYEDHRMAMAMAPLCMVFGTLIIENPAVVNKSYPHFWEDLKSLGFIIS